MTLDLTRPEHRDALRWACGVYINEPARAARMATANFGGFPYPAHLEPRVISFRALSSPSQSAAIVRALLDGLGIEPCGLPYPDWMHVRCCRAKGHEPPHADCIGGDGFECADTEHHKHSQIDGKPLDVPSPKIPALILRLLDAKDRDGALAALREHGR